MDAEVIVEDHDHVFTLRWDSLDIQEISRSNLNLKVDDETEIITKLMEQGFTLFKRLIKYFYEEFKGKISYVHGRPFIIGVIHDDDESHGFQKHVSSDAVENALSYLVQKWTVPQIPNRNAELFLKFQGLGACHKNEGNHERNNDSEHAQCNRNDTGGLDSGQSHVEYIPQNSDSCEGQDLGYQSKTNQDKHAMVKSKDPSRKICQESSNREGAVYNEYLRKFEQKTKDKIHEKHSDLDASSKNGATCDQQEQTNITEHRMRTTESTDPPTNNGVVNVFIFNTTKRLGQQGLEQLKRYATILINNIEDDALTFETEQSAAVIVFGEETIVLINRSCDCSAIKDAIEGLSYGGESTLLEALKDLSKIESLQVPSRFIIITDGRDGQQVEKELISHLKTGRYTKTSSFIWIPVGEADLDHLKMLAQMSEGKIVNDEKQLTQLCRRI